MPKNASSNHSFKEEEKKVKIGSTVKILFQNGEERSYTIAYKGDLSQNIISFESPLASSILGATIGEERTFSVAQNKKKVKILDIK